MRKICVCFTSGYYELAVIRSIEGLGACFGPRTNGQGQEEGE